MVAAAAPVERNTLQTQRIRAAIRERREVRMGLAELLYQALGGALPLRLELYDGSSAGPPDAKATLRVRSPEGLARFLSRPGELGIVRAYVSCDVDIEGDLFTALEEAAGLDLSLTTIDPVAVA